MPMFIKSHLNIYFDVLKKEHKQKKPPPQKNPNMQIQKFLNSVHIYFVPKHLQAEK